MKKILISIVFAVVVMPLWSQQQQEELKQVFSEQQLQEKYPLHFQVVGFTLGPAGYWLTLQDPESGMFYQTSIDTSFIRGNPYIPKKGSMVVAHAAQQKWSRPGNWILIPFVRDGKVEELKARVTSIGQ